MRRRRPEKRVILPDPVFNDLVVTKFVNNLMVSGKKSIAEKIVGKTKFFLLKTYINIQADKTTSLTVKSALAKTPAGKMIILPSSAARVE